MANSSSILLDFIHQRMLELGYERTDYRLRSFAIELSQQTRFSAFNEYWYFFSVQVPPKFSIESDTGLLTEPQAAYYTNFNLYGYKEFTGNILIKYIGPPYYFEFIRVTIIKKESC